ncbi:MAG: sel1 repeat family protein [Clostridia bacterium]|nr:sel1 repeat family protein [Clostridia bacterium]
MSPVICVEFYTVKDRLLHPVNIIFAVFIVSVIVGIIITYLKRKKFESSSELGKADYDSIQEIQKLCKNYSGEELYKMACAFLDEEGHKTDYKQWKMFMRASAENGYIPAVREWGIYQKNTDNALAVELLSRAVKEGDGKAVEELYDLYYFGSYGGTPKIEKDKGKAAEFIKPLAENGNTVAQRLLGNYYNYEADNGKEALEWYLKAAEGGDAEAMTEAADIYWYKDDYEAHKRFLLKAAEQNYATAEMSLGNFYYTLDEPDFKQAMYWYKRAADHGFTTAYCDVGNMYLNGEGVPKDEYQAVEWFKKAVEKGSLYGMYLYGKCLMDGTGVAQDKEKGIKLYVKAAVYDGYAQYALGMCYLEGNGVKKDLHKAVEYLEKAANNAIKPEQAQEKLDELYASGVIKKS